VHPPHKANQNSKIDVPSRGDATPTQHPRNDAVRLLAQQPNQFVLTRIVQRLWRRWGAAGAVPTFDRVRVPERVWKVLSAVRLT
jgi:hypothetical protein